MDVYLSRARVKEFRRWWLPKESLIEKMETLFYDAGLDVLKKTGPNVGIKLHMGEPGNVHYLRPVYAWKLVNILKSLGCKPTIVETTGLGTVPGRTSASKHIEAARRNGFTEDAIGASMEIVDGDRGLEMISIDGVSVAKGITELDSMVVLSHATGHIQAGFGGALKNIALGCVAKPGKYRVHHDAAPKIDDGVCTACGECASICPAEAVAQEPMRITGKCISCGDCIDACPVHAIHAGFTSAATLSKRIAENAAAVVKAMKGRISYMTLLMDILPHCDCHPHSDIPVVPDIGILASKDPVAIDKAAVDLINASPGILGSEAETVGAIETGVDKLTKLNPKTKWSTQLMEAESLKIGKMEYELKEIV